MKINKDNVIVEYNGKIIRNIIDMEVEEFPPFTQYVDGTVFNPPSA